LMGTSEVRPVRLSVSVSESGIGWDSARRVSRVGWWFVWLVGI
jgi:hypothetical protein